MLSSGLPHEHRMHARTHTHTEGGAECQSLVLTLIPPLVSSGSLLCLKRRIHVFISFYRVHAYITHGPWRDKRVNL